MTEHELTPIVAEHRSPMYEIAPLILNRWSARAMSGHSIPPDEFMPLFEAARWAASSRNNQPWRFRYATRDSDDWDDFFALLSDGNQPWAGRAALLVVILSRTTYQESGEPKPFVRNGGSLGEFRVGRHSSRVRRAPNARIRQNRSARNTECPTRRPH